MRVVILDYGAGNLHSVHQSFARAAEALRLDVCVAAQADALQSASHIVLPGVGTFGDCMAGLRAIPDLIAALNEAVIGRQIPFLGICVGMQLMCTRGLEHGEHTGLGWIDATVEPIAPVAGLRIPHMGWNELQLQQADHPLFRHITTGDHAYFVHSYQARCAAASDCLATTDYGQPVTAAIGRGNIMGTQFHPEKSQRVGLQLIENFLSLSSRA